jgi:DnaK suppressor protein
MGAVAGAMLLRYKTRPPSHRSKFDMAKKQSSASKKKSAPARTAGKPAAKKSAAPRKPAAKKPVAKKTVSKATAAAKSAAKKPAGKPAAKKAAAGKPAAKPAARKPAAGKTAAAKPPVNRKTATAHGTGKTGARHGVTATATMSKTATHRKPRAGKASDVTREDGRYALPTTVEIELPKGYRPKASEEYMGPRQLAYFRNKLREWRAQLVEESRQTMENLREEVRDVGDDAERATRETENSLELRTRDRYRKLIAKIDDALRRIEDGRYGYCEETDEEIGIERLEARPIATLSLDAQERREHLRKQMGD